MDKGESTTKKKRKYVRVACVNCRRSKTGCDVSRPCKRCVQHGWESTCIDRPTKSTSSNDSTSEEVACLSPFTNPSPPLAYNTNTDNPSPSTEKEYLLDVIARLQRKNYEQELQIQSYERGIHSQAVFSKFALCRWNFVYPDCQLISFSQGFIDLVEYTPQVLSSTFPCSRLYPPSYCTRNFHQFLASGTVDSFVTRLPIQKGTGVIIDTLVFITIDYDNNIPTSSSFCISEFTHTNSTFICIPYFEPVHVKYRLNVPTTTITQSPSKHRSIP